MRRPLKRRSHKVLSRPSRCSEISFLLTTGLSMAKNSSDIQAIEDKKRADRERVYGGEIIHTPAGQAAWRKLQSNSGPNTSVSTHTSVTTSTSARPVTPTNSPRFNERSSGKSGGLGLFVGLIIVFLFFSSEFEPHSPAPIGKAGGDGNQPTAPSPLPTTIASPSNPDVAPPAIAYPTAQPALSVDWFFSTPFQVEVGEPLNLVLRWQPTEANEHATIEAFIISRDAPQRRTQISSRTAVQPGETSLRMFLPLDAAPGRYELETVSLLGGTERREERVNFVLLPRRNAAAPDPVPQRAEVDSPDATPPVAPKPFTAPGFNEDIYKGS